jgi:hypothetical protein
MFTGGIKSPVIRSDAGEHHSTRRGTQNTYNRIKRVKCAVPFNMRQQRAENEKIKLN